jgi:DNA-binding MarR family transcriptional regulator
MSRRHAKLTDEDFAALLELRDGLRRFLHWSEDQARAVGVTGTQHQLLLAIRGHGSAPSIGDIAEHLLLRHHSVVELVDRAERASLVERYDDDVDQRVVRVRLTGEGDAKLTALAAAHIEELARLRASFASLFEPRPAPPRAERRG